MARKKQNVGGEEKNVGAGRGNPKTTPEDANIVEAEISQATEELETSKEEMQSLNEELTTVHSELQAKVEALARINDDMNNPAFERQTGLFNDITTGETSG